MLRVTKCRPPRLATAAATLVAALASGCLGHFYEIPRAELERLVQTPPQERGQSVYAIQQFTTAPEPEPAPDWEPPEGTPPPGYAYSETGYWVPYFYLRYGGPMYRPRRPSYLGGSVHAATPVKGSQPATPAPVKKAAAALAEEGAAKLVAAAIVVGMVAGVGMAVSEGARYEGTVAVHPQHPVHLWHPGGGHSVVPLDELSAGHLQTTQTAVLAGREGAGMWLLDRAPLNRQGFTYQFAAGGDSLALPAWRLVHGPGFHFALGYFPSRQLGLLADTRLAAGSDASGSFHHIRLGLEGQWYPLALWRLHLGAFAGAGQSWSGSEGPALPTTDSARPYVSFGGLAELDLTTRLALTFRWGLDFLPVAGPDTPRLASSWLVGLAVY